MSNCNRMNSKTSGLAPSPLPSPPMGAREKGRPFLIKWRDPYAHMAEASFLQSKSTSVALLQFRPDLHEDVVITPGGGSIGFLIMIRLQNEMAGGEQHASDIRILPHFFARGCDDELIMRAGCLGPI